MLKKFLLILSLFFSLSSLSQAVSTGALFHHTFDPIAGNPRGNVTVVEFFDYQCSHCVNMVSIIDNIIKSNPNVLVIFKEYPIRGEESQLATRAALAANRQNKYYAFNHNLFATNSPITKDLLFSIAQNLHLNMKRFENDMNSRSVSNQIANTIQLAREIGVQGTPTFLIGKSNATSTSQLELVYGEMSQSELQNAIDKASR